jgi:hypothetical protein
MDEELNIESGIHCKNTLPSTTADHVHELEKKELLLLSVPGEPLFSTLEI